MYTLSQKSLSKLEGLDDRLVKIVCRAITLTSIDFGVICGLRTMKEQEGLVKAGLSQTLASKHIDGLAVDLMAYVDGRGCWELSVYDDIADAMKKAATEEGVAIRWGAAWNIDDIRAWDGTMEQAMNHYIDARRLTGRRPFIDGPHFELMD